MVNQFRIYKYIIKEVLIINETGGFPHFFKKKKEVLIEHVRLIAI
jgi:hypothetical protein